MIFFVFVIILKFVKDNLQTVEPMDIFIVMENPPTWNNETNSVYLRVGKNAGGNLSGINFIVHFGDTSKSKYSLVFIR